jgi:alpha-beta hydrolase superfamily lysophospholipase
MRKLFYLFPTGFLVYGAICGAYYFLQDKIIFHPVKTPENYQYPFKVNFTEHNLITKDNVKINMVWLKANNPKGIIVYCHGNADNIDRWGQIAERLIPNGYDILVYDYRSFGKSTGTLSESTLFSDAQMIYDFAKQHYEPSKIILYGRSLGTGVATKIAATNPAKHLILETPYFSMLEMSNRYANWLPTEIILQYPLRTDLHLVQVQCPITIFHGTEDEVVPYESGLQLKPLLKKQDEFVTIVDGMHGNLELYEEYQTKIRQLLE